MHKLSSPTARTSGQTTKEFLQHPLGLRRGERSMTDCFPPVLTMQRNYRLMGHQREVVIPTAQQRHGRRVALTLFRGTVESYKTVLLARPMGQTGRDLMSQTHFAP